MPKNKNNKDFFDGEDESAEDEDAKLFREALDSIDDQELSKKLHAEKEELAESKPKKSKAKNRIKLDLHGMRLDEAIRHTSSRIEQMIAKQDRSVLEVITGKGRHSDETGGVLVKEVYGQLKKRYSHQFEFLDSDPGLDLIGGLPIRGFFRMRLK